MVMLSSLAKAREIKCSTLNTEIQGTFILGEISLTLDSKKLKKNSVVEKSESAKASVGQTPTQAAASTPVEAVKLGRLSFKLIESGQISTHFVQLENLLVALTQALTSKCKPISFPLLLVSHNVVKFFQSHIQSHSTKTLKQVQHRHDTMAFVIPVLR